MYAQVEKPKENKSRPVANSVAQKKSSGKQGFGFVDNRPEYIPLKKNKGEITQEKMPKNHQITNSTPFREPVCQLVPKWVDYKSEGLYGTKESVIRFIYALEVSYENSIPEHTYLDMTQRQKLGSYKNEIDALNGRAKLLPDDKGLRNSIAPVDGGAWSVLRAGINNVINWQRSLNDNALTGDWKGEVALLLEDVNDLISVIAYYEEVAMTPPAPVSSPAKHDDETIKLYRKMWSGEAKIIMEKTVFAAMGDNDNYKKYFTTSPNHTDKFHNANSKDPDDEVVIEVSIKWNDYWKFVSSYGAPNQKKGALANKDTAILNQEQIVKGKTANFVVDEQVTKVIDKNEDHNIGVGAGNVKEFDKIVIGKKTIG